MTTDPLPSDLGQGVVPLSIPRPRPLPFLAGLVHHLQAEEPGLWKWFSSSQKQAEERENMRLDLLKSTYRLEQDAQPDLYEMAHAVRDNLGGAALLFLYQSAASGGIMNASLAYLAGEAHIVLTGPVLSMLAREELRSILAHELAHYLLYEDAQGDYFIALQLIRALANDAMAAPSHCESARLYSLYTELFADRWSLAVVGDLHVVIAALVKVHTGLSDVSGESYLRQAEEILSKGPVVANEISHPELYIRARALQLWAERGDDAHAEIEQLIEGPLSLQRMDLLGQTRAAALTRRLMDELLAPAWFQSEAVLAHARLYFPDYSSPTAADDSQEWIETARSADASMQDYLCYVLLDFVSVDRELGDPALAAALVLSRRLGLDKRFSELVHKELGLGKKVLARIDKEAESILEKTAAMIQTA